MTLRLLKVLTIAVAVALIALILHAGDPATLWWWLAAIPFGGWIVSPAVAPYAIARRYRGASWFVGVMLAFLALSSAWSAWVYYQAFFTSESSTAALVLIFAPLFQWGALTGVVLLSAAAGWVCRRRGGRAS